MTPFAPMPIIDDFLLQYNVGQAVLLLFILTLPAGFVRSSHKITGINTTMFGLLFIVVPSIGAPVHYAFVGIALLVVGPVVYTTAGR